MNFQYQVALLGIGAGSPYAAISFGLSEPDEVVRVINGGSPMYAELEQKTRIGNDWAYVEDEEFMELIPIILAAITLRP